MKSTQVNKVKKKVEQINYKSSLLKNSIIAGITGFLSWILIFILFDPLAGLFKIGYFDLDVNLLLDFQIYFNSLVVGLIFFLFFYFTLKYKESTPIAKIIMWIGIVLYSLFYMGFLFLLFFFRFTDL